MFYLISLNGEVGIIDHVKEKILTYKMIIKNLQQICHQSVIQIVDFSFVDTDGCYFEKKDGRIELRKYTSSKGYVYNTFSYEVIGDFCIVEYKKEKELKTVNNEIKKGIILKKNIKK